MNDAVNPAPPRTPGQPSTGPALARLPKVGGLRDLAAVAAFFIIASVGMTWPLVTHITTHIPGDGGDAPMFVWNLWWVKHALLDLHQWPWVTHFIFYPQGVNLSFHTLTAFHGMLSIPIQLASSPVVASNLLFLWSLAATGVGTWLLARHGGASRGAALAAGAAFTFSPWVFAQARGHYNLSATWIVPIFVLLLFRALDSGRLRWAAGAGAALAVMTLNEYQYGAFGLLLMAVAVPLRRRLWPLPDLLPTARLLAVLGGMTMLLLMPLLLAAAEQVVRGLPVADSLATATFFSADLTNFLTPYGLRWGGRPQDFLYGTPQFVGIGGADGTVYLGWACLAMAAIGLASVRNVGAEYRRWLVLWGMVAVLFLVLALGPFLHLFGHDTFTLGDWTFRVPLPYLALSHVPVLGTTRVPTRFTVMAMLALALLAAAGVDTLRAALARDREGTAARRLAFGIPATVLALMLADVGVAPLWLQPVAPSPFYRQIAAEPGDFAVLELPLGQSVGPGTVSGQVEPYFQYCQTIHGKRLFNGHVSRERPERVEPLRRRAGFGWLISNGATLPDGPHINHAEVQATFWELNVRYAIVHPAFFADLSAKSRVQEYLESYLDATEVYRDDDVIAYRIGTGARQPAADGRIMPRTPAPGSVAESRTPVLRWEQRDPNASTEQVQISLDRDFGPRGFLYFETIDRDEIPEPHSYRVPHQYPLQPGKRYYWRVRGLVNGKPGPWSPVGTFWSPEDGDGASVGRR